MLGSSEAFVEPFHDREPGDWNYFHVSPDLKGIEFRGVSDGLYEQVFVHHPSTDPFHSVWYTFPDRQEYIPGDLFSKHPSKPDLWHYEGRADDVIVFSNGEKFKPSSMEATLRSHPDVQQVLVVGQARFQTAALIDFKDERSPSDLDKKSILESLEPYLAKANESAYGYAKLQPEYITFTKPKKPMPTTDKGTIKRAAAIKLYQEEIDQVYADAENLAMSSLAVDLDLNDKGSLTESLRSMIGTVIKLDSLKPDQDIFNAGADSLQVMNIVKQLQASVKNQGDNFPANLVSAKIVYSNPTAAQLAKALHQLATLGEAVYKDMEEKRLRSMEDMLAKYSEALPEKVEKSIKKDDRLTIILTGSTGSLGSYLVDALLANQQVSKIICLNRSEHSEEKQNSANESRGLTTSWGDRVSFLKTDLSKTRLGLSAQDYEVLLAETSYIIRKFAISRSSMTVTYPCKDNQWQVDFNLSLDSFEPHVAGVRSLIDLSIQSAKRPPIMFTSSISTLTNWSSKNGNDKVPEKAFHDLTIPAPMGYGESKYIAELLLEAAHKTSGLSASICRVGQVAGPVEKGGMWNKQEWLPSVSSSLSASKLSILRIAFPCSS